MVQQSSEVRTSCRGLLGSGLAKVDATPGPPRRLKLPPAKSEAVYATAMVLRHAITQYEKARPSIAEPKTPFTAPEVELQACFLLTPGP